MLVGGWNGRKESLEPFSPAIVVSGQWDSSMRCAAVKESKMWRDVEAYGSLMRPIYRMRAACGHNRPGVVHQ